MPLKLTFDIRLSSDYHIGAGYGLGIGIDSALFRDSDGIPVIRGTSVAGLLRDGLYRLLELPLMQKYRACENSGLINDGITSFCGQHGNGHLCPICRLFGTPIMPKRWNFSSSRPVGFLVPLSEGLWKAGVGASQKVQRVRVNPRTRRADPSKLFSQEEGNGRLTFRFTITCADNDESALDDAALLVAVARNIRQLGRSRRRGLGECIISLVDAEGLDQDHSIQEQTCQDWFLDRFKSTWLEGNPRLLSRSSVMPSIEPVQSSSGSGLRLRMIVRLNEPLLIANRAEVGNQFNTCQAIPGTVVLGALAGFASKRCDLSDPDTYHDFVALFLRGRISFPSLYPACYLQNNLYPTTPAPFGLLTCKVFPINGDETGHGVDSVFKLNETVECSKCESRLEPVSGFVVLKQKGPYTYEPDRSAEMHIRIDPKSNRVSSGDLYSYTVLDAGQYFVGELICADETAWNRLQEMTGMSEVVPHSLRFGKAMRRGYGDSTVWIEPCNGTPQTWIQVPLNQRISDPMQPFTLTLLTDTIITDGWGRQATGFESVWLEEELGLGPVKVKNEDAYVKVRQIDGFNNRKGLPRWRDHALMAGSTVSLRLMEPPSNWAELMGMLELNGIGLRRNEGFGRLAFNHPVYELCKDVAGSEIPLDSKMRLANEPDDNAFVVNRNFGRYWDRKLEEFEPKLDHVCKDSRFSALARWMYAHSHTPLDNLREALEEIGEPDDGLKAFVGGEDEYGDRLKDNFFETKGKDGIELICNVIEKLAREPNVHHPVGLQKLAKMIEEIVKNNEKIRGAP